MAEILNIEDFGGLREEMEEIEDDQATDELHAYIDACRVFPIQGWEESLFSKLLLAMTSLERGKVMIEAVKLISKREGAVPLAERWGSLLK